MSQPSFRLASTPPPVAPRRAWPLASGARSASWQVAASRASVVHLDEESGAGQRRELETRRGRRCARCAGGAQRLHNRVNPPAPASHTFVRYKNAGAFSGRTQGKFDGRNSLRSRGVSCYGSASLRYRPRVGSHRARHPSSHLGAGRRSRSRRFLTQGRFHDSDSHARLLCSRRARRRCRASPWRSRRPRSTSKPARSPACTSLATASSRATTHADDQLHFGIIDTAPRARALVSPTGNATQFYFNGNDGALGLVRTDARAVQPGEASLPPSCRWILASAQTTVIVAVGTKAGQLAGHAAYWEFRRPARPAIAPSPPTPARLTSRPSAPSSSRDFYACSLVGSVICSQPTHEQRPVRDRRHQVTAVPEPTTHRAVGAGPARTGPACPPAAADIHETSRKSP